MSLPDLPDDATRLRRAIGDAARWDQRGRQLLDAVLPRALDDALALELLPKFREHGYAYRSYGWGFAEPAPDGPPVLGVADPGARLDPRLLLAAAEAVRPASGREHCVGLAVGALLRRAQEAGADGHARAWAAVAGLALVANELPPDVRRRGSRGRGSYQAPAFEALTWAGLFTGFPHALDLGRLLIRLRNMRGPGQIPTSPSIALLASAGVDELDHDHEPQDLRAARHEVAAELEAIALELANEAQAPKPAAAAPVAPARPTARVQLVVLEALESRRGRFASETDLGAALVRAGFKPTSLRPAIKKLRAAGWPIDTAPDDASDQGWRLN
jgi:hypothetical protein